MAELAVVFDMDGTLVTFNFDIQGTRKALLGELGARGFEPAGLSLTSPTQTIVDSVRDQILSGHVKADFAEVRARLYHMLDTFEIQSASSTLVLPETVETLDYLRNKGVRTGLLTNSGRLGAAAVLQRSGLQDRFQIILTRDDVDAMKPRPEGLVKASSLLGVPIGELYYVGDSLYDIEAAKRAGARSVSVSTGNYSSQKLKERGADFVIATLAELPSLLGV